jgi:glycosyltransferase involved in cell wall biosynthesis
MPAYQGLADRALASLTDRAIAVSHSTREFLVRERFVPPDRVRLIWNGAPLDEFAPAGPHRGRRVRRDLGLPEGALVVGSIGRLNAQKGHRFLLEAAAPLCRRRRDLRVLVVGDGDLMEDLRGQASTLGIAERVVFAGHRTDVPDVLAALDVFCISSLYEGTPLALFEAMAAGRAVVSTAVDGCREVLEDGESGLLVPPGDAGALEAALDRVLGDPGLRDALGRGALEASRAYDVRSCVAQMEALYDEILEERGG